MKIRLVEADCSMRIDGWTDEQRDMTKLIIAMSNIVNTPNKYF